VTAAARASRERARLIAQSERLRRKWHHAAIQQARVRARLDELAGEMAEAAAVVAALEADPSEAER
jgi:chromosome condensin MukBEF ATPase and DNA-binding subunit MukB